jgi:hypothetical protein
MHLRDGEHLSQVEGKSLDLRGEILNRDAQTQERHSLLNKPTISGAEIAAFLCNGSDRDFRLGKAKKH